jgi:hydrogenase/urease accessory protein HupE
MQHVHAHEIGTTLVTARFAENHTYDIEIVTDAIALVEKIEASGGRTLAPHVSLSEVLTLLTTSEEKFRQRVKISFDREFVRPALTYSVEPPVDAASATTATIHLTGQIPPDARQFTWNFGWTFTTYALTLQNPHSDRPVTLWLEGGDTSEPLAIDRPAPKSDRSEIALQYLKLGFTHIVPYGFDHVLFVLGIYLLSRRARSVLWQVSAFTVAHSITLGLSMYGVISLPSRIVEPMIAISIAYVAVENIFIKELKSWRVALVFAFGLLHGMGFAGALRELGIPRSEFITALATFNVGVEAGQLAVIALAFTLVGWHYSTRSWYRSRIVVPASAMIAVTAVYWTAERLSLL